MPAKSQNVHGHPCVRTSGNGAGPEPRSWRACTVTPSISPRTCGQRFMAASCARQSNPSRQYEVSARRYEPGTPYVHSSPGGSHVRSSAHTVLSRRSPGSTTRSSGISTRNGSSTSAPPGWPISRPYVRRQMESAHRSPSRRGGRADGHDDRQLRGSRARSSARSSRTAAHRSSSPHPGRGAARLVEALEQPLVASLDLAAAGAVREDVEALLLDAVENLLGD